MGDEVLVGFCALLAVTAIVTVVGHTIWIVLAAVFRGIAGTPPQSVGRPCPQCGAKASVIDGRCTACGAVPAITPGAAQRDELRSTARQLWRMLEQGRITQRQYDDLIVHVMADLSRHGVSLPTTAPLAPAPAAAVEAEIVDAQLVELESPFLAGTKPGPGAAPVAPPSPAARQKPGPPTVPHPPEFAPCPPELAPPPAPVFVEPPKPARSLADMLQSFMEESNIRWGEILAALLIVLSSVGLVISLRNQLRYIPYFPAILFTLFTVSFHGAGLYTLRRWKLHAVSRVILIISLLLVPLTFSAAVVMSGSGEAQRPVTDPLFLLALTIGTAVFAWVSWSASRELAGEAQWRLAIGVLGCSLSQVLIQRVNLVGASFWTINGVAAIPLVCFLIATVGQLARARRWPQLSHQRANQIFLVLGVAAFALLAPLALLLARAEPRWQAASWLSPALSFAAATILASGLLVHRRATSRDLAIVQTAGTAVLFCGGFLLLVLVVLAWPDPELLCAVGVVNAVMLIGLALAARLAWLHAPAIACVALAAVMGLHLVQGRFENREDLPQQIIEASLMARSSLVLAFLAAAAGVVGVWQRRDRRDESLVYFGGAGVLAVFGIAVAAVAGFLPIPGWQQDTDLAGRLLLLYALAFIAAGHFAPWPAVAGVGSFLLWAALVQLLRLNSSFRNMLDAMGLVPDRPIPAATLIHAVTTALTCAVKTGRQMFAPRDEFRRFEDSPLAEQLVQPLAIGAAISLVAAVPLILWDWSASHLMHAGYALAAAVAWAAVALAKRWSGAISGLQAMLALSPALLVAGAWKLLDQPDWPFSAGHVQAQLVLVAAAGIGWALVRRLTSGSELSRDLLEAPWPPVDQILLAAVTIALPVWAFAVSLPSIGWELGFQDTAAAPGRPIHPLAPVDAHGWIALAAVVAAIVVSLWERVSPGALIALGIATFAAVFHGAQYWHDTNSVASAVRWAAAIYAVVWALPFIFREPLNAAAKRLVWLRWEQSPREIVHWFCAQPLVLGGTTNLVLTIIAVAQNASGVALRGPAPPSVFDWMGPTAAYAVPLLALVAVHLAYAVRERQAAFALGGSAVFQLAINLAFILHVTLSQQTLPQSVRWIEWLQWNAAAAGVYALIWLILGRWINGDREAQARSRTMLDVQIFVGSGLAIALVLFAAADTIATPLAPSLETNQLGHWLSYFAAAVVLGAFGWHVVRRISAGWADIAVWLAVALVAFIACSVDQFDAARQWQSYHTLTAGWLAVGAIATALITLLAGTKPGPGAAEPISTAASPGASLLASLLPAIGPHHLSAALVAGLLLLLAVRGASADPAGPWWSLAASLVPLAMTTSLGLVRRSQPYAHASVVIAGLTMILFWVAPATHPWYRLLFDDTPAAIELILLAAILTAGFWLWREADTQHRENASFDQHFIGPRVHAAVILVLLPLYFPLRLGLAFTGAEVLRFEGYEIAATVTIIAWGVLLVGTLWDRRAWFSLPMLYLWGFTVWAGIVGLVQALLPTADERLAVLLLALALQIAASGQLWSYGANLSLLGSRLGVSDPIGGLKRTEWWLPPVNLLFAGALCFAQLFLVLSLERVEIRVLAALSPAIAAWGVLCLAQEKRRDPLQLTALLLAGLAAIYLGWAQLDPSESPQTWGLTRAFRLLMVLAAVTFLYGLVLPRWLLTGGSWNAAVRKAGHVAGASAIATFIAVLVLEAMLFTPGVDAPIDGVQVAAIAVVLVGLIAGLLSLALLPGRDPLALTETGRQWYVYAAEATAALLFAHLYICRPTWFDTVLRPYWPLVIMGIAFLGVGASELCHRWRIRVLAEPLEKTGGLLPLLPVLGMWVISATNTDYALLLLVVGILYLVLSFTRKSWAALVAAAVAGNGALWALLHREGFDITANPQLWLIPPALSVLASAQLNKHRLDANVLTAIRYLATIVIYVSSTSEIFIRGVGETLWPPMILTGLAVAGAMLGIMLRIRAFLYLGTSFTLLGLVTMVWHAARAIEHVWPWWAFGIGLGIAILVLFGVFEKKRPEMLLLIARLRQWEQ